jgi:hypothetical protein
MGRLPREEEIKRRNKMRMMIDEGYDHNQIADTLGMRPQNVLQMMRRMENIAEEEIITPRQQRETLNEVTDRVYIDLDEIDELLEVMKEDPAKFEVRIEKLYRLKLEFYNELANTWALPQSIVANKQNLSSISGDKVQVNIDKIDYKKLDEAARKAAKVLDEARLDEKKDD